jgi:hypothetical protein
VGQNIIIIVIILITTTTTTAVVININKHVLHLLQALTYARESLHATTASTRWLRESQILLLLTALLPETFFKLDADAVHFKLKTFCTSIR